MRPQKPHFNPLAALAAVLAAVVLAVCEIPEAMTVPEASEALTEPPGGFDDPYGGDWPDDSVAADGGDDDDDEDQYTCFDPEDCWKKCPLKSRDGSSVSCECNKNKSGSGWTCDVKNGFIDGGAAATPAKRDAAAAAAATSVAEHWRSARN